MEASSKEEIIGIFCNPQEGEFVERWKSSNLSDINVTEMIPAFKVRRERMVNFMNETGLFDRDCDGFVFDTARFDRKALMSILHELQARGKKMYSARGETSRPDWIN